MANSTWSGPVRSENGFQDVTKNTTTGAVTTNAKLSSSGVVIAPDSLADANASITAANNAGRITIVPDGGQDNTYTLPTPAEAGESYRFIYGGAAADATNVAIAGPTTNNSVFYVGGVTFANTANELSTVYSNGSSDSLMTLITPAAFDVTFVAVNTSAYAISGTVTSNTAPTIAEQS